MGLGNLSLTLQQAQNLQHSSSSSPRRRIRKMSSGMSQRKLPGGHSARDSSTGCDCRAAARGGNGESTATALREMEQPISAWELLSWCSQ